MFTGLTLSQRKAKVRQIEILRHAWHNVLCNKIMLVSETTTPNLAFSQKILRRQYNTARVDTLGIGAFVCL